MSGKCIACDRCDARLGLEEVSTREEQHGLTGAILRERARLRGWLCIDVLNQDVCPNCAENERLALAAAAAR